MRLLDARDRGGMRFLLFCGRWPVAQHGLKAQLLALDQRPFQIARLWWRARFPQRREGSSERIGLLSRRSGGFIIRLRYLDYGSDRPSLMRRTMQIAVDPGQR